MLSLLFSVLATAALAADGAEGETEEEDDGITVIYNRNYEEGWDYGVGVYAIPRAQRFEIEYEEDENFNYNYYWRLEGRVNESSQYGYFDLLTGGNAPSDGISVLEFDIKTDDAIKNMNQMIQFRYSSAGTFVELGRVNNQKLLLPDIDKMTLHTISSGNYLATDWLDNEWLHLAYVFDFDHRYCKECDKLINDTHIKSESDILCTKHNLKASELPQTIKMTIYYGDTKTFDAEKAIYNGDRAGAKDNSKTYKYDTYFVLDKAQRAQIHSVRFAVSTQLITFCLDNLRMYNMTNGQTTPLKDLPQDVYGYGDNINPLTDKTINILKNANQKTDMQVVEEALAMKVGVNYVLSAGNKKAILTDKLGNDYGAPVEIDGQVYVPLQAILDHIGFPVFPHADGLSFDISTDNGSAFISIGRDSVKVNGETRDLDVAPGYIVDKKTGNSYLAIALSDVDKIFDGYHATYDDMGFILVTEAVYDKEGNVTDVLNRDDHLDMMLDIMKKFVVDFATSEEYYELAAQKTDSFKHPYLLADQATFDQLHAAYLLTSSDAMFDQNLSDYIRRFFFSVNTVYNKYAEEVDHQYAGLLENAAANPYLDGNNGGYSASGRLTELVEHAEAMRTLALAYQITREEKYALLAYEIAAELAAWTHWGDDYFLDTANAVTPYALTYDWLYNVWTEKELDLTLIETALYEKGILQGYNASNGMKSDNPRAQESMRNYTEMDSYWNAVCTSSMAIASLALLGAEDRATAEERLGDNADLYASISECAGWILENNVKSLVLYGLDAYAPDGSFFPGPEFWQKTTDAFGTMLWALIDTTGETFGMTDIWGFSDTFNYAMYIEYTTATKGEVAGELAEFNSGYTYWNYHDSIAGTLDTSLFFFASELLGDETYAAYRMMQISAKQVSYLDLISYKREYSEIDPSSIKLELDYVLDGCAGVVSRDTFDNGGLFVGIMGNKNNGSYGQVDSGNFIYANKGVTWLMDPGSENNNVYDYFGAPENRYSYYRMNAEGANVILITTPSAQDAMPYGQDLTGGGYIEKYESNEHGMYAVINNASAYGGLVNDARRGLLVTNDRTTVVVQDEMAFSQVQTVVWVAHTTVGRSNIKISSDGRTAYFSQVIGANTVTMRASIVSDLGMRFDTTSASDILLSTTMKKGQSESNGGASEYNRSNLERLTITWDNAKMFVCAVVFEIVDVKAETEVQYKWTDMKNWTISESFVTPEAEKVNPQLADISKYSANASRYLYLETAFEEDFESFFEALAKVQAAIDYYPLKSILAVRELADAYYDYQDALEYYTAYREAVNADIEVLRQVTNKTVGLEEE